MLAVNRATMASMFGRRLVQDLGRRVRRVLVPPSLVAGIDELHRRLERLEAERATREADVASLLAGLEQAQQERLELHRRTERTERLESESPSPPAF